MGSAMDLNSRNGKERNLGDSEKNAKKTMINESALKVPYRFSFEWFFDMIWFVLRDTEQGPLGKEEEKDVKRI